MMYYTDILCGSNNRKKMSKIKSDNHENQIFYIFNASMLFLKRNKVYYLNVNL